jgi:hypothetical protein
MAKLWGIIIYDIAGDGCLNGLWNNNNNSKMRVMNEIARNMQDEPNAIYSDDITGLYTVSGIDERGNKPNCDELRVSSTPNSSIYRFEWNNLGNRVFTGSGFRIGLNKIAITYWDGAGLSLR